MMLDEKDIKRAAEVLAKCEKDLGYTLTRGQTVDLLADNFCDEHSEWSLEKCRAVTDALNTSHGVGAFHRAEARKSWRWIGYRN